MSSQQNLKYIIFVTHVDVEDLYLKIWGQLDKNAAASVERMVLPLVEQFARGLGCPGSQPNDLRVNDLCCARFQNEGYYRARVLNVCSDGMVVLHFIDHGNIEILPLQEIHLLQHIPGSESLQTFPPVAYEFTLAHLLPINGIWENKTVESIKKILCYNEYNIQVQTVIDKHRLIKMWYNNEDFAELLINKQMAIPATLMEMFRKQLQHPHIPMYQQPNKTLTTNNYTPVAPAQNIILNSVQCSGNNMQTPWHNINPSCAPQQKQVMQQPVVQEALEFKSRVLDVGSKHDVYVSFVEDGPQKFSVQVQSTSQTLSKLMRDINSHPTELLQEPPLPGSVCLGRYTQDKVLCRAVIMSVMENKCKLYYVDFGHTEILPYTDIFRLPLQYIRPRVLSIRFTLSGVKDLNVTPDMKEYFKKVVSRKSLVLHVRPPEGSPLVQYGDLYDNGQNVKDMLLQAFPAPTAITNPPTNIVTYKKSPQLSKGMEEIVHVSFVESCRKFFVQLDSGTQSLESIMACLAEFCRNAPPLSPSKIMIGLPCAALYENQWYRAQILNVIAEKVRVVYVDYGNEETIPVTSLRVIHNDLVEKLQIQAIKCILNGYETLPPSEKICNQFEVLTLEKRLRMMVVQVQCDTVFVDLYDPERMEDIKSQLLSAVPDGRNLNASLHSQGDKPQHSEKFNNTKGFQSKESNKWPKKNHTDTWHQLYEGNVHQGKNKSKHWKDEPNAERWRDEKNEENNYYDFNDVKNQSVNRDDFQKSVKYKSHDKYEQSETDTPLRNTRSTRGSRHRPSGSDTRLSYGSDKSCSDKDSDTSFKGSNKRGRGGANRSYRGKRGSMSSRLQSNRWSEKNNDAGIYRSGKLNGDNSHGNIRPKDKKSPTQKTSGKTNTYNTSSLPTFDAPLNRNNMQYRKEHHIPQPNITNGATRKCEVVFVNSPVDFFVQLSQNYAELDTLMLKIAKIYENGGEIMMESKIQKGTYCIAQYMEDCKWYRAIIKHVERPRATVQFLDYGNIETIELTNIKVIKAEFLQLPIQAIHCKLLGIESTTCNESITKHFEDAVQGKTLEAEFVKEENGLNTILLREIIEDVPKPTFINEELGENIDLIKLKEAILNSGKIYNNQQQTPSSEYTSTDSRWLTNTYKFGSELNVIITWFTNPNNFYCQSLVKEIEFKAMMNEIQKLYVGKKPVINGLQIGSPVIAIFTEDGALYRGEIVELNKLNGHVVQYIDFGNCAIVEKSKIYPVETKLLMLPKQAFHCTLKDIVPKSGSLWSKVNTQDIDHCFGADKYSCTFHALKNNKYIISLNDNGTDIGDVLVKKNLASFATNESVVKNNDGPTQIVASCNNANRMDISLLTGQIIRVKVSSVESVNKFYIQLPSAAECESIIDTYMANKDHKILAIPGELSVMQNQAIECSIRDNNLSEEVNKNFKECVEGKETILFVEEVEHNRLIVKLYDLNGNKILVSEGVDEKICPICPMPILYSTHKVLVSYADSYSSIWLQRYSDYNLDTSLQQALESYYSTSGQTIKPEIGQVCVARGSDGHWYRGKIVNCSDSLVCVHFIDYGNTEEVNPDVIMALDQQFHLPHQLAVNVSLPVKLPGTIAEQISVLQNHLANREITAVFYNVHGKWVVELFFQDEKISDKLRSLEVSVHQEQSTAAASPSEVCTMTTGCKYEVCLSHADTPNQFWLRCANESASLTEMQERLQVEAPSFAPIDGVPEEGSLCVAVYSINNNWYRAEVLDADEDITTIRFIDYGNTDVIDNKSGNIRQIADSWKSIPPYAVKCRLDVIPMIGEDWTEAVCEKFENLVSSSDDLRALIIAESVPKRVDLLSNDKSISAILVKENCAVMVHTEEDLIDEIVDLELDPHSAFVSHINSPSEFWVQEEKSVVDLEVMSDRSIMADMFPRIKKVEPGSLCVAKFPEDGQWYRARIVSHDETGTHVIYIDYGNSATSTEIRAIPEDLANVPPLSRKCSLVLPEGVVEWSEKACNEFVRLAADGATIFLLEVIKEDETSLVKLVSRHKNVADLLGELCERHPPIDEERLPPLGAENAPRVFISHVNEVWEFWIQTESSIADLEAMLDRLQAAPSFLPLEQCEVGTVCAAEYPEDGQWYRAKILSHSESSTKVLYIDYGNSADTTDLRILPEDVINIPALSKRCTLKLPENLASWPVDACTKFKDLAADGATMFQFEFLDNEDPTCVRLNLSGEDIVAAITSVNDNLVEDAQEGVDNMEEKRVISKLNGQGTVEMPLENMNETGCDTYNENNKNVRLMSDDTVKGTEDKEGEEEKNVCSSKQTVDGLTLECQRLQDTGEVEQNQDTIMNDEKQCKLSITQILTNLSIAPCTSNDNPNNEADEVAISNLPDTLGEERSTSNIMTELSIDDIVETMTRNAMVDIENEETLLSDANIEKNPATLEPYVIDVHEQASEAVEKTSIDQTSVKSCNIDETQDIEKQSISSKDSSIVDPSKTVQVKEKLSRAATQDIINKDLDRNKFDESEQISSSDEIVAEDRKLDDAIESDSVARDEDVLIRTKADSSLELEVAMSTDVTQDFHTVNTSMEESSDQGQLVENSLSEECDTVDTQKLKNAFSKKTLKNETSENQVPKKLPAEKTDILDVQKTVDVISENTSTKESPDHKQIVDKAFPEKANIEETQKLANVSEEASTKDLPDNEQTMDKTLSEKADIADIQTFVDTVSEEDSMKDTSDVNQVMETLSEKTDIGDAQKSVDLVSEKASMKEWPVDKTLLERTGISDTQKSVDVSDGVCMKGLPDDTKIMDMTLSERAHISDTQKLIDVSEKIEKTSDVSSLDNIPKNEV
ncbi:hypothetical protein KM043_018050 [Ampulex compressa]|nr:hypothetical protein KM043_018050 [Ampulex compressa]